MTARPDLGHVMTRKHYERLAREAAAEPTASRQHHARPALVNLSGPELIARHTRMASIGACVGAHGALVVDPDWSAA